MHADVGGRRMHHVNFAGDGPSPGQQSPMSSGSCTSNPARPDLQATVIEPMHEIVPLSSVPAEVLGVKPEQQKPHAQLAKSSITSGTTTAGSTKTGRLSQLVDTDEIKSKAEDLKLHINRPRQVTGRDTKYSVALAWAGRIGWVGKAVVYAMIGGLAVQAAISNSTPDPNLVEAEQVSASPQGAFVLLSSTGEVSIVILLIMMAALAAYITWRFWEGLAGQGYDETFSAKKNFFKFRVSPIVSGAVYVSYMIFLINVLDRTVRQVPSQEGTAKEGWPATWRHSAGGRVGLAFLGIAFIIATCIQLQGVLTRQWHRDYRSDLPRPLMLAVFTIGHFGFAGRAGAFLAMAVMFFKDAGGVDTVHSSSMVANALQQLQVNRGLRAILIIVGVLLILYGMFATLSAFTRMFPTPPPSRRKRVPAEEYKAHKARKEDRRRWLAERAAHFARIGKLPLHHHHDAHPNGNNPQNGQAITAHDAGHDGTTTARREDNGSMQGAPCYDPSCNAAPGLPQQQSLEMALSGASSVPVMFDEAAGWGKDQGLGKSASVKRVRNQQQQQGLARGSGANSDTQFWPEGPSGPLGQHIADPAAGWPAGGFAWPGRFVLPSQRPTSGAIPAAAAAVAAGGSEGHHEVQSATSGGDPHSRSSAGPLAEGVEFVTINPLKNASE